LKTLHKFLNSKKSSTFFNISNPTLIANPYVSEFPKDWAFGNKKDGWIFQFLKVTPFFYFKMSIKLALFTVQKIFFPKKINETEVLIDTFLVSSNFTNKYFPYLPEVLEKRKISYSYLLRIYGNRLFPPNTKNGFYEFQVVEFSDIPKMFFQIFLYPFQTISLLDNKDQTFNYHLAKDIKSQSFEAFSRYWVGKRIAEMNFKKIISWSEFQVIERTFNFGYKTNGGKGKIYGSQLFFVYPTHINMEVFNKDVEILSSPDYVLTNGKYQVKKNSHYKLGVSLRYKHIFEFKNNQERTNILLLGSYSKEYTSSLINICRNLNLQLKLHPTHKSTDFQIPQNFELVSGNLYDFFQTSNIVITTGSGTAVEAVAVGISVIIIESKENLTSNPLAKFGQGEIWEIVSEYQELETAIEKLQSFRKNNEERISTISNWYKDNFLVKPTEENIIKAFEF
jgi:hypothetical protein